jgi:hypothetical protein
MIMYKKYKDYDNNLIDNAIIRIEDGVTIPFDPANTDYQEYLAWLAEGNEPLPPDEPEGQTA